MERERKHIIKIPESVLQQLRDSEQTQTQSAPAVRRKHLKKHYRRRLIIRSAVFLLIPLAIIGSVIWAMTYKNAVEVYASDTLIGTVRLDKQLSPESLAKDTQDKLEADNQTAVNISPAISLKPVHVGKAALTDKNALVDKLCGVIPFQVQASAFVLDGKPLAILKDQAEAFTVRDNIFAKYTGGGGTVESVSFVEDVTIEDIFAEKTAIITMDNAIGALTAETARSSVYTVEQGDVLGQIAVKNNMSLSDLIAANPGITAKSTLTIGQQLQIKTVTPLLSVQTVETVVKDDVTPAPVQQQVNPRATARRILQAGVDGKQRITERVTMINGIVQDAAVVNTVSLEDPIPEIIEIPQN